MITPLGNLNVGGVGCGEADTRRVIIGDVGGAPGDLDKRPLILLVEQAVEEGTSRLDLVEPHEGVHLGELLGQVGRVTLGKAPSHHKLLPRLGTVQTAAMGLQDRPDALLLGRIDESAGVDQHDVGLVGLGGEFVAVALGIAEHDLGIDEVLGATEADQADFTGFDGMGRSAHGMTWDGAREETVTHGMERTRASWRNALQVPASMRIRTR